MTEPANQEKFITAVEELLATKGLELPTMPDSPGRRAYLSFISSRGYQEKQLLPIFDTSKRTPEMGAAVFVGLMQALKQDSPELLRFVSWLAVNTLTGRDNTNLLIYQLTESLLKDLQTEKIAFPPFFAGVFPTDSFNAQCYPYQSQNLILINTGCMELASTVTTAFFSKKTDSEKVDDFALAVQKYVDTGQRTEATAIEAPGVDWGTAIVSRVLNAVEEFIIAHELGHLVLGHVQEGATRNMGANGDLAVVSKTPFQEFQADVWAFKTLTSRAITVSTSASQLAVVLAGPMIALGIALVVEAAAAARKPISSDGHPPARERLYLLQILYELLRVHRDSGLAYQFDTLVKLCLSTRFPAAQPPPFLDRDLNRKLIPVLRSLDVNLEHAAFVTEFS
jgi:hypothetical protein